MREELNKLDNIPVENSDEDSDNDSDDTDLDSDLDDDAGTTSNAVNPLNIGSQYEEAKLTSQQHSHHSQQ